MSRWEVAGGVIAASKRNFHTLLGLSWQGHYVDQVITPKCSDPRRICTFKRLMIN